MTNVVQKPNMNLGLWASNGNYSQPEPNKVELGWVVEKPLKETMNWVQNRQDTMLQYLNQHGIAEWDSLTTYPVDAFVARNGVVFKAISQNIDKDPTSNVEIWKVAFSTFQDFDDLKKDVEKIKSVDGYLTKYVKKSEPVMDGVSKGVGYAGQDLSKGVFFDSNQNAYIKNSATAEYSFNGTNTQENDVIRRSDLQAILEGYTRYKVGDLYVTTNQDNPAIILGYGTWVRFGEGQALVGVSDISNQGVPTWTKFINSQFGDYDSDVTIPLDGWDIEGNEIKTSKMGHLVVGSGRTENVEKLESLAHVSKDRSFPLSNVQPSVVVAIWRRVS